MKRFIWIIALAVATVAFGAGTTKVGGSAKTKVGGSGKTKVAPVSAPASTLLFDGFSSGTSAFNVGRASNSTFCGMNNWVDGSNHTITRLDFKITGQWSVPSTYDTYVMNAVISPGTGSGTYNNGTPQGTSDNVQCDHTWNASTVTFNFSTPYAYTASSHINLALKQGTIDLNNYTDVLYANPGILVGALDQWDGSGVSQLTNTFSGTPPGNISIQVRIWGY